MDSKTIEQQLMAVNQQLMAKEQQLRAANHCLSERVKELNCLFDLSHLVDSPESSLEKILQGTCDLIKESWQYPDITCVRIVVDDKVYKTANFKTSQWKQSANILVDDKVVGQIEVFYLEDKPELNEGPFLKEERFLLNSLAERLGKITKRKQTEEEFTEIFEMSLDMICIADINTATFKKINPAFTRILGYKEEELLGGSFLDFIHPDDKESTISVIEDELKKGKKVINFENRYLTKKGTYRWINWLSHPIPEKGITFAVAHDITESKRAEEALRKSESHLRTLIETLPDLVWLKDPDGVYLACNPKFERFFGAKEADIVGKTDYDFVDKELANFFRKNDRVAMTSDKPCMNEENLTFADDGHQDYTETIKTAMFDSDGKLVGVLGVGRDITERKQAEKALRESREVLQAVINSIPVRVFWKNKELRYLGCNTPFARDAGFESPEDIIGKDDYAMGWQEQAEIYRADDFSVIESGNAKLNIEEPQTTPSGEQICLLTSKVPLRDADGAIVGVLGTYHDITERKQAEKALIKSELEYRSTVENLLVGVVVHGSDSNILLSNSEASNILGLTTEQMLGKEAHDPIWCFVYEDTSKMANEDYPIAKVIASKKPLNDYILGITRADRNYITWVNVSAIPIFSDDGELDKVIINFIDITETKRLQKLESRAERLESAGTIAGQIAHDFNNLLAPMIAYPEFIKEELPENHPTLKYLDQIEKAAHRIADINQQLLTLSRRGHYNQDTLNLNTIVHQAVNDMAPMADNVTRETDLDPDLMNILGGGSQIHRVITNLLCNAVDALQGVGQINIKTENYYADDVIGAYGRVPRGEYVKLTISDTGCGISDDIVQKVIDPFFTTKTTDQKRGSGLGLSVVDAVVKDHNGYLDLRTQPGKGTSFYLYFPTTRKSSDEDHSDKTSGGNETILIVDDDDIQRDVSTQLLKRLGYEVNSVVSGEKAIELLREKPHDIVILDMVMPGGIDGAETYQQVLEINPNQKAIIVSGFSESDRVKIAFELGAGAFVKKPLTKKAIAVAVRTELDRKLKAAIT